MEKSEQVIVPAPLRSSDLDDDPAADNPSSFLISDSTVAITHAFIQN